MTLKQTYKDKIVPTLMSEFSIHNVMAVPKILKVSINMGIKDMAHDKGLIEKIAAQMAAVAGQKPKLTKAKIAIANFKLRAGDPVGMTVTLRGNRMYDFMTKLFEIVLPRVRDFQGVSTTAFDHAGNYTLGLSEQIIFPEIDYGKIDKIRGLEISFVINSGSPEISQRLLQLLGMPFSKKK
jgi:large subunit ribosomal protein L5